MKFKHKFGLFLVFLICCAILVISTETQTVFNPFTQKPDMVRTGNFSDVDFISVNDLSVTGDLNVTGNLNMTENNITDVQCIIWMNGAEDCGSS